MSTLSAFDVGGFTGKDVELWVKVPSATTEPNVTDVTAVQIRGAQNFNPTEEKGETKVSELGYEAQKTIYGTTNFTCSTSLLVRDLLQIARMGGMESTDRRISVSDFNPINVISYVRDPDSLTTIKSTIVTTGFKPRTASKALAVEANATITLDGSADLVVWVQGKATVREHYGDGTCKYFAMSSDVTAETEVYSVEYPSGTPLALWDGYTYVASGVESIPNISFTTAPTDGYKLRIVYKAT